MLKRKIDKNLKEWKNDPNKVCMVVKGARQVGKTFSIDQFCKKEYQYYLYINFEEHPEAKQAFDQDLDVDMIVMMLSVLFPDTELVPHSTVIFLDEIQVCPKARTALKFFSLDKRYDVIASGSLLGLNYNEVSSYPVGYEDVVEMYSLDFEEFLWALDIKEDSISYLHDCLNKKVSIMEPIHKKMKTYFLWYIIAGGMPAVVNEFIENRNFSRVLKIQKRIIDGYMNDIAKYAKNGDRIKAKQCFLSIPEQLAKTNKKFQFSLIENYGQYSKYESSLQWLEDAGIISYCYDLNEPRIPLAMHKVANKFKIYMNDTGLLISMLENGAQKAILKGDLLVNNGAIFENIIAEMLVKKGYDLYYFEKKGKLEIDFMLNIEGNLYALEVKSGDNQKAKSLNVLLSDMYKVPNGIKLTKDNISYENAILKLPWYMMMFI